ncbi:MAG: polysaccharide pyruvyl transferase family protein [Chitinispirillaceae bacterium]
MTKHSQQNTLRIGISGSYGGFNLGDEAILQSIIAQLRILHKAEITVFSRDPYDTSRRHRVERVVAVRKLSRDEAEEEVARLDVFILGGGGILYDADAKTYLREPILALERGVPVMVYAISAGPLYLPVMQDLVRDCLNKVSVITVRDYHSRRVLEDAGVRHAIQVTADPALLLEPEPLDADVFKREGIDPGRRLVGISVREPGVAAPDINEEKYHLILANTADYIIDRFNADVVFIPMERKVFDLQHSHAVISLMLRPQNATVLQGDYTSGQLLSIIGRLNFAVGMRLHFLLFAALQQVPFVGLPYSPKVNGFLEELHLEMPPIHFVNAGRLIAHIDHAWDNRMSVLQRIKRYVPELKERAMKNGAALERIIMKGNPETDQS